MKTKLLVVGAVLSSLALGGCLGVDEAPAQVAQSARSTATGAPTLMVTATVDAPVCVDDAAADVHIAGSLVSTGSVAPATITAAVDGGAATTVGTLASESFVHDGRTKTAPYDVTLRLANGEHSVELCFAQPGAGGNAGRQVCTTVTVTVSCARSCSAARAFGNIVGNPNLCAGNGPPHIPVHVEGGFGAAASLTITGPGGFSHDATLRRAGDSCNYHYNWDSAGNGGAGTYTFTVEGNGNRLTFTAELGCRTR